MREETRLKNGATLQGGEYRILSVLGQGGFGITYEAEQVALGRKVAVKEFFMEEYCNRDGDTSQVSVPSMGSKETVDRFRAKFVKEAKMIAGLDHQNIIRIYDVFEENGTAYYVMEYLSGGSLLDLQKSKDRLSESDALGYIRQAASALDYIHSLKINHLDIKPGNILLDGKGRAVLIDFGLSKRYDVEGNQTSTTPVGISHGYAPFEQYKTGGVGTFSPATDIYSLGATLYRLLTGRTPPDADVINDDGFPANPGYVSDRVWKAIEAAMQPRRKDRPQSIADFWGLLNGKAAVVGADDEKTDFDDSRDDESTQLDDAKVNPVKTIKPNMKEATPAPKPSRLKWAMLAAGLLMAAGLFFFLRPKPVPTTGPLTVHPVKPAKPATAKLYVTTTPTGALVTIDGKSIGKTPIKGSEVAKGNHSVKISKDGYDAYTAKLSFEDDPVVVNETLKEKPVQTSSSANQSSPSATQTQSSATQPAQNRPTTGTHNGHDWVDLGLSVKWATCNVGASSPTDYGNYYAWGEVRTKSEYTDYNSTTYEKSMGDIAGNSTYDAARYNWGGKWRLPTKAEYQELVDNCTWTWTTQGGHNGMKVTSKKNGASIFLPAAGLRYGSSLYYAGENGDYWSSTPYESDIQYSYYLDFRSGDHYVVQGSRNVGISVRPVSE